MWITARGYEHIKEDGVFVQARSDGSVFVRTEADTDLSIYHKIYDGEKVVGAFSGESFVLKGAKAWSTESPAMYRLVTRVKKGGRIVDEVETWFGFRDIRFDSNTGFWLNGKNMKLKGMCLHQDASSLGVAVQDEVWLRRLKALKEIGCNDKDAFLLHPCCPSGSEPHMGIDTLTGVPSGLFLPIYMHNEAVFSLYINIRCNIK